SFFVTDRLVQADKNFRRVRFFVTGFHTTLIQEPICQDSIVSNSDSAASLRRLFQQYRSSTTEAVEAPGPCTSVLPRLYRICASAPARKPHCCLRSPQSSYSFFWPRSMRAGRSRFPYFSWSRLACSAR